MEINCGAEKMFKLTDKQKVTILDVSAAIVIGVVIALLLVYGLSK
jgi:hypothetical protein